MVSVLLSAALVGVLHVGSVVSILDILIEFLFGA